jgi:hypothetical protein
MRAGPPLPASAGTVEKHVMAGHVGEDWPLLEIEDAYTRAFAAVDDPAALLLEPAIWLSAHLAATQLVVYPAARRHLGDDSALSVLARHTIRLEEALRLLERQQSGDASAIRMDAARLTRSLVELATIHARAERALLRRMSEHLSVPEQRLLLQDYRRALEHAPTRPHPHMPHTGRLGALAFAVDGRRDRLMDGLDGRYAPTRSRARRPRKLSRWASFLHARRHALSATTTNVPNPATVVPVRDEARREQRER